MPFVPASKLLHVPLRGESSSSASVKETAPRPEPGRKEDDGLVDDQQILTKGLAALKMRQVPQALELLSRAINVHHRSDPEVLLRALEARAVAYEQIRDYKAAQGDCRSLIAQFPTSPKGYLRLGKIYRLQKLLEPALRIYAVGMRRAGHDDLFLRQVEATQQQLARRQQQLFSETGDSGSSIIDPFAVLPVEVLHCIWSCLSEGDRLELGRMSRASARYRWRASSHRHHVYLSSPTASINGQAIQSHLAIPGRKIQAITCSSAAACQALFKLLTRHRLPNLHKLTLRGMDLTGLLANPPAVVTSLLHRQLATLTLEGCLLNAPTYALLGRSESLQRLCLWQCRLTPASASLPPDHQLPLLQHRRHPSVALLCDLSGPSGIMSSWYRVYGGELTDRPLVLETATQGGYHVGRRAVAIGADDVPWLPLLSQGEMAIRHLVLFPPPAALDAARLEGWLRRMPAHQLCSLHILTPCLSMAQLARILAEDQFPALREISIHALSDGVIEPVRLLAILQTPLVRLVGLPVLAGLTPDRQRAIRAANRRPDQCRVIFDREQSLRITRRRWRLAPWARQAESDHHYRWRNWG